MQEVVEEIRVRQPICRRVAEDLLDLRADVERALALAVELVHVDGERQLLDETLVPTFRLCMRDLRRLARIPHRTEVVHEGGGDDLSVDFCACDRELDRDVCSVLPYQLGLERPCELFRGSAQNVMEAGAMLVAPGGRHDRVRDRPADDL